MPHVSSFRYPIIFSLVFFFLSSSAFSQTFGPETILRQKGKPATSSWDFTAQPGSSYTLQVFNGGINGQYSKASSAVISLNGSQVFGPSDFAQKLAFREKPVSLLANNTITVEIRSAPTCALTIQIIGSGSGDTVPPSITASLSPLPNQAGWNNTPTTISFSCSDNEGPISFCSAPILVSTEGSNQTFTGTATDQAGNQASINVSVNLDSSLPSIDFLTPTNGSTIFSPTPQFILELGDNISGIDFNSLSFSLNNAPVSAQCQPTSSGAACSLANPLDVGNYTVTASISDLASSQSNPVSVSFSIASIDTTPPTISILSPQNGFLTNQPNIRIIGSLSETSEVRINGILIFLQPDLSFDFDPGPLMEGENSYTITAVDSSGNSSSVILNVFLDTTPPNPADGSKITANIIIQGEVAITGTNSSVEPNAFVYVVRSNTGQRTITQANAAGAFLATVLGEPDEQFEIIVVDGLGNQSPPVFIQSPLLPPGPIFLPTHINRTVATNFADATSFLYTGPHAFQIGVQPGTIEPERVAVLRGKVSDQDGNPLAEATIKILGHPEFGCTKTRADGQFDIAVNGGGALTIQYSKAGYLSAQRIVDSPWRDYVWADDVVLIQPDAQATLVDFTELVETQVARGSVQSDDSGARQATLLFQPDTQASLVFSDGSTQSVSTLNIRATEYTVGPLGPQRMPAELPPSSGYTYAVELSADEAEAANAKSIQFSKPVIFYLENFLGFPTGAQVPVGLYDPDKGVWIPEENGRVIEVLGISGGLAELAVNESTGLATQAELDELGITPEELETLATLYQPGQSLWRVSTSHFSTIDLNWLIRTLEDLLQPFFDWLDGNLPVDDCHLDCGSIIETANQTLGESIPISGTSLNLKYSSDRTEGRTAAFTLDVQLEETPIPDGVQSISVEVSVAGQRFNQELPATAGQSVNFLWDGKDAYNRQLQGQQLASIRVSYNYSGLYVLSRTPRAFGSSNIGEISNIVARQTFPTSTGKQTLIGNFNAPATGLGGWSLDSHHSYDPVGGTLYSGSGTRRSSQSISEAMKTVKIVDAAANPITIRPHGIAIAPDGTTYVSTYTAENRVWKIAPNGLTTPFAGNGTFGFSGDGGPATSAQLAGPKGLALAPDGSLYIAEHFNDRIRKVAPDGTISTIAGRDNYSSDAFFSGDNGPASLALIYEPQWCDFGPDGALYVSDTGNNRVRRIASDGTITTVAGNGLSGFSGDGGLATNARTIPQGIDIGSDGSIYIAGQNRIRKVSPAGIITTIAGTGTAGFSGDGGLATAARVNNPATVAIASDGSLYIGDTNNNRIRKVSPTGIITTIAGTGIAGFSGDGGLATLANISGGAAKIRIDTSGNIYLADSGNHRIRKIDAVSGIITTIAGNGSAGNSGNGGLATAAQLRDPQDVFPASDGSFYIADRGNESIRKVDPTGIITTIAGTGIRDWAGDGGPAVLARLALPRSVSLDSNGNVYIVDNDNDRIRKIDSNGIISTFAGNGIGFFSGDGGPATQAKLSLPTDVAVAQDGSLYIADNDNSRIRKISTDGIISTYAGSGNPYMTANSSPYTNYPDGDGGPASQARLRFPEGLAVAPDGSVYFAEPAYCTVRKITPNGIVQAFAGITDYCASFSRITDTGNPAKDTLLNRIAALALMEDGSLLMSSDYGLGVYKVDTNGILTALAGNMAGGSLVENGVATSSALFEAASVAVKPNGDVFLADWNSSKIRRVFSPQPSFSFDDILIPSEDGSIVHTFDSSGRHLSTRNAITGNALQSFSYDSQGFLTSIVDEDQNTTTIERDVSGNPTSIVGPYGQRTNLSYNSVGLLSSVTDAENQSYALTYQDEKGLLTGFRKPNGALHSMAYDSKGFLVSDQDPLGGSKQFPARTSSTSGFNTQLTTIQGRSKSYNVENLPTGEERRINTSSSGLQTQTTIKLDKGQRTVRPNGIISDYNLGPDPRFGMQAPVVSSYTVSTPGGRVSNFSTSKTATLADPDDPFSLLQETSSVTVNGRTFTSVFDASSMTVTGSSPLGKQSTTYLDSRGRPISSHVPGLFDTSVVYDSRGRIESASQGLRRTEFQYDASGRIQSVTDALFRTTSFEYDAVGRVTRQVLPDTREILYSYDENGNITSITPPSKPAHNFFYTVVNLLEDYVAPDIFGLPAPTNHYSYNLDKQVTQVVRPDGQTIDYSYDFAGRLESIEFDQGSTSYVYDQTTGNLASVLAPGNELISFAYDGSLLTETGWTGSINGSIERTYNNDFRLTSQSINNGFNVAFSYDLDGLLSQAGSMSFSRNPLNGLLTATILGAVSDSLAYNSFGEVTGYTVNANSSPLFSVNYVRDAIGRIEDKTETVLGQTITEHYIYDMAGRLTDVHEDGQPVAHYEYDDNGNRTSLMDSSGTTTAIYDAQDRLLTYGNLSFTYNANGELESKTDTSLSETTLYEYDVLGNLRTVTLPDGTAVTYTIDAMNRRIGKSVNGVLKQAWLYEGISPVAELDGSGNVVARFVPGGMVKNGILYRIIRDHLGSPRLVVNASTGAIAQRMDFDEWGNVLSDTAPGFQPFGFAGGLWDADTGLVRFGARDYMPEIGRWTAKDPIRFEGGDSNLYGYVLGDPINLRDPLGLDAITDDLQLRYEFYQLWDDAGFGRKDYERSAWIVKKPDGNYCTVRWPWSAQRNKETWKGKPPEGYVGIAHTHPDNRDWKPSTGGTEEKPKDDYTSVQINAPVYTITRKGLWKIDPQGNITEEAGRNWYKSIGKEGCPCPD